jgi:transposase
MPAERAPMRKVREVLRLKHALGVSERQIANTVGVSRSTVGEYLRRAAVIGITWPVPGGMDDGELAGCSHRRRSMRSRHGRCPIGCRCTGS